VLIVDLLSTHKTFVKRSEESSKMELEGLVSYQVYKNDVVMFGTSNREYIVDIDRSEVERYILEQERSLKENGKPQLERVENYDELSRK
jgi:hypothetical protein